MVAPAACTCIPHMLQSSVYFIASLLSAHLRGLLSHISAGIADWAQSGSWLQGDLSHLESPEEGASRQPSGSRPSSSRPSGSRRTLRRNESRNEQASGYAQAQAQEEDQPKKLSGWAKLRMARRVQGNVKAIQVCTHCTSQCTVVYACLKHIVQSLCSGAAMIF